MKLTGPTPSEKPTNRPTELSSKALKERKKLKTPNRLSHLPKVREMAEENRLRGSEATS
jgi:hypothetical protein